MMHYSHYITSGCRGLSSPSPHVPVGMEAHFSGLLLSSQAVVVVILNSYFKSNKEASYTWPQGYLDPGTETGGSDASSSNIFY